MRRQAGSGGDWNWYLKFDMKVQHQSQDGGSPDREGAMGVLQTERGEVQEQHGGKRVTSVRTARSRGCCVQQGPGHGGAGQGQCLKVSEELDPCPELWEVTALF